MRAIVLGWIIVTVTYLITLITSMNTVGYFLDDYLMKMFVGVILILVPYAIAGIYAGKVFGNFKLGAFWVSFVPMICERVIIYFISLRFVKEGLSEWNYITPIYFIQKKVFYFTLPYILLGIFSIVVTILVAKRISNKRSTNNFSY